MFGYLPSWLQRDWGICFLVLMTGLMVAPRSVEAGCGEYVTVSRPQRNVHSLSLSRHSESHQLHSSATKILNQLKQQRRSAGSPQNLTFRVPSDQFLPRNTLPPRQSPCHGPACSKGEIPPVTQIVDARVPNDRWMDLDQPFSSSDHCSTQLFAEPRDDVASGYGLNIYRPPEPSTIRGRA